MEAIRNLGAAALTTIAKWTQFGSAPSEDQEFQRILRDTFQGDPEDSAPVEIDKFIKQV